MNYDRTERIRRAAILVASLEEAMAEVLLRDLPPLEAAKVFAELDRLDSIDPEEQQDVLDEFRGATRQADRGAEAVEFSYSAPSATPTSSRIEPVVVTPAVDADVLAMAEVLSHEHPQIIAAALSRLDGDQGAAVFAELSAELQAEVLDRVSRLAPADEAAVLEIESELQRKVGERRERRERAAAGAELARNLVAKTAPEQRLVLLERISAKKPEAVAAPTPASAPAPVAKTSWWSRRSGRGTGQHALDGRTAVRSGVPEGVTFQLGKGRDELERTDRDRAAVVNEAESVLEDQSAALLALSDEAIVAALQAVDEETGRRALAASSEKLIKRITRRLPRGQARGLRKMLRSFGPTSLTDLRRAQHELLRMARESHVGAAAA